MESAIGQMPEIFLWFTRTTIIVHVLPLFRFSLFPSFSVTLYGSFTGGSNVSSGYECRTENTRGGIVHNEEKEDEKNLCVKNRIYNSLSRYSPTLRGGREKIMSLGGQSKYTNDSHLTKFNEIIYQ